MFRKTLALAMSGLLLLGFPGSAAVFVSDTWDADENWASKNVGGGAAFGTLTDPDSDLNGTGVSGLMITRNAGAGAEIDYIYATQDLLGNWTTMGGTGVKSVRFDFYSQAGGAVDYPAGLRLYFLSGSGNVWYYTIDVSTLASGWGSYGANIDSSLWWSETGVNFLSDLTDVDEVGIWLSYQPGYSGQIFGLDDFGLDNEFLPIPEPGTYAALGFALLSIAISFRRKLDEGLVRVRASLGLG